jgi:predicted oxidoreductase
MLADENLQVGGKAWIEMKTIKLSEKLSLSAVVQGFWRLEDWKWTAQELAKFMNECIERGITSFDTAEIYSATLCEKLMGEAFAEDKSIRGKIQLVSKTGIFQEKINGETFGYYNTSYERVMQSCKESLQRLQTDYLDLYLIHREDPCFNPWETARALKDLKKEGLIKEVGVSNFDPFKFDALNQAMDGGLVTNQIEWNPVCFEHFNSGMMDYLTVKRIHPMIWSPLAGGRLFKGGDELCHKAMEKIKEIAKRHNEEPETIIYAWLMYHPAGAVPISGSNKLERLDLAIKALDVELEHYEWYEIYVASGQQVLR